MLPSCKKKKEKQSSQSIPKRCCHCEILSDFPGWNLAPPISWVVEASVRPRRRLGESHIFATAHASADVLDLQLQMRLVLLLPVSLLP